MSVDVSLVVVAVTAALLVGLWYRPKMPFPLVGIWFAFTTVVLAGVSAII